MTDVAVATKVCSVCEEAKPLDEFHRRAAASDGRQSRCKDCAIALAKEWAEDNPERKRKNQREWARRRRAKSARYERLYGITMDDYDQMLEEQEGLCAICGQEPQGEGFTNDVLHVDHDHESGEVRGLLCTHCNHGLGKFQDDPATLLRAADYLMGVTEGRPDRESVLFD